MSQATQGRALHSQQTNIEILSGENLFEELLFCSKSHYVVVLCIIGDGRYAQKI